MRIFATVCSGIGAPELAARDLGWECVFGSEIAEFPNAVRAHHFPGVPNWGNMENYHEWPLRKFDVLIGGTPCQSFSVAGLRAGLADPRGNLALVFLGIVERFAPTWVLWENVPGVHSSWSDAAAHPAGEASRVLIEAARREVKHAGIDLGSDFGPDEFEEVDQSNDFDCFLGGLAKLGYGVAYRILDAQYDGVAQRRCRVFVVGHIGGSWERAAAVLFDREGMCRNSAPRREAGKGIAASLAPSLTGSGRGTERTGESRGQDPVIAETSEVAGTLTKSYAANYGRTAGNNGGVTPGHPLPIPINMQCATKAKDGRNSPHGLGIGKPGDPANTLGANDRHAVAIGIDGSDLSFTLRASRSRDRDDGGMNQTMVVHALKGEGFDGSEDGTGRGVPLVPDVCGTLSDGAHHGGGITGRMSTPDELSRCLNAGGMGRRDWETETLIPMPRGGFFSAAVRRLTPRECERLQGFPDDFTAVKFRGKPAADGPRYKALGNSMCVNTIRWILGRIDEVEAVLPRQK